jgi:hypothetical protein
MEQLQFGCIKKCTGNTDAYGETRQLRLGMIGKGTQKQLVRQRHFSQWSILRTCSGGKTTSVSFQKGA